MVAVDVAEEAAAVAVEDAVDEYRTLQTRVKR